VNQDSISDYVVIGAGTAGAVVVRRLLDAGHRVTVLEGGARDDKDEISSPFGAMALFGSEVDWALSTVAQEHANDRVMYQPRGKALGGSTILNGMLFIRGSASDYDAWAAQGAKGWSWADVEPYFRKLENFDGPGDERRGTAGPVPVHYNTDADPLVRDIVAAAVEAGHPHNDDYNAGDSIGASLAQATVAGGERVTAWRAYVAQLQDSPRLQVITDALVSRVILEEGRAVGVEYLTNGERHEIRASREVVLSAGTFGTPHVLMLSGIGPAEELRKHGIEVAVDAPGVGRNLRDHVGSPVVWEAQGELPVPQMTGIEAQLITTGGPEAPVQPDWQGVFISFPFSAITDGLPEVGFTGLAVLLHPHSSGVVRLRSADPHDSPEIDPRMLSDERDIESLVDQIEQIRRVGTQASLAKWVKAEAQPGPSIVTRDQLRDYVRASVDSGHHQVGTARMGEDEMAVVDPHLRVRGVQGLRIVDASVMPTTPAGNTAAATMMIGERAADLILKDD
jgi:choline dehydrogenase